ncbi:asparaginase-domain-containing protein [Clavulina sp. PMI_390]|nr:asparaginase-domain-containing protein [Clavulina sp. PMI_390]
MPLLSPLQTQMKTESNTRKVCVIYTGGTIGMLLGEHGFQPEPFYLTSALRNETRFHDHESTSWLSNSSTIQQWRNHSRSSSGLPATPTDPPPGNYPQDHLLPTRSTRPVVQPDGSSLSVKRGESVYETNLPALTTPASSTDTKVRYVILEWQPILDSSNIERSDWIRLATEIELNYALFDAFIVLHGTDTICYTTSALSFLLEDLGKTVIVTGAQIPLSQLRNDAVDNLLGSLSIAGRYIIPEVTLYFNHTMYRGNRVSKISSFDLDAFGSPNFPPLVDVGTEIVVNWKNVLSSKEIRRFRAYKSMCEDVATLRLFPGISASSARSFLAPPIRGVVLESFGAGNAPQRADLMEAIKEACDRGVVIVTISQCAKGSVSATYAAGQILTAAGAVAGADMTPEAALTKLSYLLSKRELSVQEVRKLLAAPLRGELTMLNPSSETVPSGLEGVQQVLGQLLRLSNLSSSTPHIEITPAAPGEPSLSDKARNVTATSSLTDLDTLQTEAALLPFLVHIAAARNDQEGIKFCLAASQGVLDAQFGGINQLASPTGGSGLGSGVCNALDTSGRTPLHTAVLNRSLECVRLLLENGASVHARDIEDHTVLFYSLRKGSEEITRLLIEAGAILSGADQESSTQLSIPGASTSQQQNA